MQRRGFVRWLGGAAASSIAFAAFLRFSDGPVLVFPGGPLRAGEERWPAHVDRDDRVVLRIDGKRIEARLARVPEDSAEYGAARSARSRKFGGAGGAHEAAERDAAESIARWGRAVSAAPQSRLYRVVSREAVPSG